MASIQVRKRRSKVKINYDFPVLVVNRSNKNISAALLEPKTKKNITSVSSVILKSKKLTKTEKAKEIGKIITDVIKNKKYSKVVFDRNGYRFTGRIKSLVDSIKEGGIEI